MESLEQTLYRFKHTIEKSPQDYSRVEDFFEGIRCLKPDNPKVAHELNKFVRFITRNQVMASSDMSMCEKFYLLHKRSLLFDALTDFDAYLQYLEFDREPEKKFYLPRRKALLPVVRALQDLDDDKLDILGVSLPPGTGKTTLAIFYLSRLMGKEPNKPNLGGSHSNAFLRGFYDEILRVFTSGEYLWSDVFPGVQVTNTNAKDMMIDLDKRKRFTSLSLRSIEAGNAGLVRAENLLYCDDLCSGIEEALSKERMDSLWQKYTVDLRQRKIGRCKELHIQTRWSVHDILGRLEREYEDNERVRFISVPALDENDESNFDYQFGVGFSTAFYHDIRSTMDDISFKALYMNQPLEREGLLYNEDDLRRYYDLPSDKPDAILAVCDTAEGGGDDTFLPVGYVYGDDYYIEDCVCDNGLPEVTDALCADMLLKHSVKQCQFESNSAGGRTADKVQEKVKEKGGVTHITKKRTTANKETKIIVNSSFVKEHFIFKDKSRYAPNSSYAKMIRLLCSYTVMGKNKHDDVPDGMAQFAEYIQSLKGRAVEIIKRPF